MRKILKFEKVLIALMVLAIICGITTISKASGDLNEILPIPQLSSNNTTNTAANNTTTPTNNSATLGTNNTNTTLPKTGINDTAMWVLVAGCVVLAVYTYKKVRDYNY